MADAFTCGRCVVVGEERTQLAGTTREVLIAKFEWCIVVLGQKGAVTTADGLRRGRVHYQQVTFVTGALAVQVVALTIRRPKGAAWLALARGYTTRRGCATRGPRGNY